MMEIVHSKLSQQEPIVEKRVPLYKDKKAIEAGVIKWTLENNERLRKLKQKNQK